MLSSFSITEVYRIPNGQPLDDTKIWKHRKLHDNNSACGDSGCKAMRIIHQRSPRLYTSHAPACSEGGGGVRGVIMKATGELKMQGQDQCANRSLSFIQRNSDKYRSVLKTCMVLYW